jgi:hypothetical protein
MNDAPTRPGRSFLTSPALSGRINADNCMKLRLVGLRRRSGQGRLSDFPSC